MATRLAALRRLTGPSHFRRRYAVPAFTAAPAPSASERIGQPTPLSHPHLMAPGEVTPGVALSEYAARRAALAASLPAKSMALFPSAPLSYMSHDVPFPYRQDVDLSYLCGFQEASSLLACVKPNDAGSERWHLFVRPREPSRELWDGPSAGLPGARRHILPDGLVHALGSAADVLRGELPACDAIFLEGAGGVDATLKPLLAACQARRLAPRSVARLAQNLRVRKSDAEAALMRKSAAVCAGAFRTTMAASAMLTREGHTEDALAATFELDVRLAGAERLAYPCVVAGGANAVTLHYMHNNARLAPGSLLLMDAGCSLHGYASDLTRTWPLDGAFTAAQRRVYDAVLDVNERCIAMCVAGSGASLASIHRASLQWTFEHLVDLGILRRDDPAAASKVQRYYPHAIGHWLGLDVHDTPHVGTETALDAGMVVTVEPGLYFPPDDDALPEWCRGIGVRIEDDVLVGAAGPEVLTAGAPKHADDVEACVRRGFGAG